MTPLLWGSNVSIDHNYSVVRHASKDFFTLSKSYVTLTTFLSGSHVSIDFNTLLKSHVIIDIIVMSVRHVSLDSVALSMWNVGIDSVTLPRSHVHSPGSVTLAGSHVHSLGSITLSTSHVWADSTSPSQHMTQFASVNKSRSLTDNLHLFSWF